MHTLLNPAEVVTLLATRRMSCVTITYLISFCLQPSRGPVQRSSCWCCWLSKGKIFETVRWEENWLFRSLFQHLGKDSSSHFLCHSAACALVTPLSQCHLHSRDSVLKYPWSWHAHCMSSLTKQTPVDRPSATYCVYYVYLVLLGRTFRAELAK